MDLTPFSTILFSTDMPRLPDLEVLRWARRISWGLVLAGLGLLLMRRRRSHSPRWAQLGWVGLMLVSVCLPGQWTPSFWLGLAFQTPSLMTSALFLWVSLQQLWPGLCPRPVSAQVQDLRWLSLVGIVLGWVLVLDTFAFWSFSLYAFGFSPAAVLCVALFAIVPWVTGGGCVWRVTLTLLAGVLLMHVVLRLTTGNVWDALLDPWLWVVLQMGWLARGLRTLSAAWRARPSTHA